MPDATSRKVKVYAMTTMQEELRPSTILLVLWNDTGHLNRNLAIQCCGWGYGVILLLIQTVINSLLLSFDSASGNITISLLQMKREEKRLVQWALCKAHG